MPTSILYHGFDIYGYHHVRTSYQGGALYFHLVSFRNRCAHCKSFRVIKKGFRIRQLRTVPIGRKRVFLLVKMRRFYCQDCRLTLFEELGIAGRNRPVRPATINRELACLRALFSYAENQNLIAYNPIKRLTMLKEHNKRLRYLTIEEIERLLKAIDLEYLRVIVIIALGTGMRRGEILQLKWKYINFEEQYIEVGVDERATKSGKRRIVPIDDYVVEVLRNWKSDSEYLFCKDDRPLQEVKKSFKGALKKAGIKDFTFHDLRHTFASHAVMNGMDLYTLQKILGHSSIEMTKRYSHLSKNHLKKSVKQGSIFKKITTLGGNL